MILKTQDLTKKYRRITALNNLNLEVDRGMIFGLLGPNGSGKTTTLGLLLGVLKATSGTYFWFDLDPNADARKRIGAILESPCFYPYLTAMQNLAVVATVKECALSRREEVLEIVGLSDRRNDPFKTYSLGMKQRLAIASALLADPEVLILDEPTNGLDPQGIVEIRRLIQFIANSGKTIILASHLLDEVQKVCSHFCVLRRGEKLYQGSVEEALMEQARFEIASRDLADLRSKVAEFRGVTNIEEENRHLIVSVNHGVTTEQLNSFLIDRKVILTLLNEKTGSLEQQFLNILAEHD